MKKPRTDAQRKRERTSRARRELSRCKKARSLQTCRKHVFSQNDPHARAGKLTKAQLTRNSVGKVVSKAKSTKATLQYDRPGSGLRAWNEAARAALQGYSDVGYDDQDDYAYADYAPDSPAPSTSYAPSSLARKSGRSRQPSKRLSGYEVYGTRRR